MNRFRVGFGSVIVGRNPETGQFFMIPPKLNGVDNLDKRETVVRGIGSTLPMESFSNKLELAGGKTDRKHLEKAKWNWQKARMETAISELGEEAKVDLGSNHIFRVGGCENMLVLQQRADTLFLFAVALYYWNMDLDMMKSMVSEKGMLVFNPEEYLELDKSSVRPRDRHILEIYSRGYLNAQM